ncbi:Fur family transcriptional regulator [Bdellovibrionota bacterium FG-1]
MKKHKDLLSVLKANQMRVTPARRVLLQYFLDHKFDQFSLKQIQGCLDLKIQGVDRSSVYRNLEAFKRLAIIQELNLPKIGKRFQYVFDRQVHHFFICKFCGKLDKSNKSLFETIERALKEVHGFSKANLSVVFYGHCSRCQKRGNWIPEL